MRLLVCGGAGFIGSNFVRQRLLEHGDEVTVLDKLTYAGREENFHDFAEDPALPFRARGDRGSRGRGGVLDAHGSRIEAIVNFAAETHVDRSIAEPDAFVKTHALGTYVLLEAARERGSALRAGVHRRGLRLDRGRLVHRGRRPCAPPRPTRRPRPARICSCRATSTPTTCLRDLPRLEQLRALPVSREADPADGSQRAARRFAAGVWGRDAGAQLDPRDRLRAARSGMCSSTACPARSTTRAAPTSARTSRSSSRIVELTGADPSRSIEHVTDRPGHDRRYSLSSEKVRALGWEPRVRFEEGLERPSPGIATTPGGGSRSARATIARTTSASTAAR